MRLPNENATTQEMRAFAASLSTTRRMRLAAALLYPELQEIFDDGGLTDEAQGAAETMAADLYGLDASFDIFATVVYEEI